MIKWGAPPPHLILFDKAAKYSVYEFPTGFAAEAFLTEVGGYPHPRGGIRVILPKGEQEDTPMPKRKVPTLHQYEFIPDLDTIRVKVPNGELAVIPQASNSLIIRLDAE